MSALATIGGAPILGTQAVSWTLTAGTRPYQRVFEVDRELGRGIGDRVDLVMAAPGHAPVTIEKLVVMGFLSGSRPQTKGVLVADRRALWRRITLARTYNFRRRTGAWSLAGEGRIENRPLVPEIAFAPWSLHGASPWTAEAALRDMLDSLCPGEYKIPALRRQIPVEHFDEAGEAPMVLDALLAHIGGYDCTVDPDGTVRVFDSRDRSEVEAVQAATPVHYLEGWADLTSRAYWRPRTVKVFFDRECEIRFDYNEDSSTADETTARAAPVRVPRTLENVLPAPDGSLQVGGKTVGPNTYIAFDDFFTATAGSWAQSRNLSHEEVRRYWLGWDYADNIFVFSVAGAPDPVQAKRLATVRRNWRQLFRLTPKWRDHVRSVRDYRLAIIDPATGTRGTAPVYCNWLKKHTTTHLFRTRAQNPHLGYQDVAGYAALLASARAAPARVRMIDEDAGVFRVDLQLDPFGEGDAIVPGTVATLPTMAVNDGSLLWAGVPLEDGWQMAVVLTAIQASPNNEGRFHFARVSPGDAEAKLGEPIGPCLGPEWEVKIGGGLLTAKFAWLDSLAEAIEGAFFDGTEYPPDLLVNREEVQQVATAEAARLYSSMLDRVEGSFATPINPSIVVTGALASVQHSIDPLGIARTFLALAPELEPLPVDAFLPQSVRRVIRRLVQP